MAIFIGYDDPRIIANAAQAAGQFRTDQILREQDRQDAELGLQQQQANQHNELAHEQLDQQVTLHKMALDAETERLKQQFGQQLALEGVREQAIRQRDQESDTRDAARQSANIKEQRGAIAEEADKQRGFKVMQGVGGAIEKGVAGVWNAVTGNTPGARAGDTQDRIDARAALDRAQRRAAEIDRQTRQQYTQEVSALRNNENFKMQQYLAAKAENDAIVGRQKKADHAKSVLGPALGAWKQAHADLQERMKRGPATGQATAGGAGNPMPSGAPLWDNGQGAPAPAGPDMSGSSGASFGDVSPYVTNPAAAGAVSQSNIPSAGGVPFMVQPQDNTPVPAMNTAGQNLPEGALLRSRSTGRMFKVIGGQLVEMET